MSRERADPLVRFGPAYFRFRVTPDPFIAIGTLVKKPGDQAAGKQVELVISGSIRTSPANSCEGQAGRAHLTAKQ